MGKHRMIDPKEYEHLELVFNILKYPSLKNTVRRLNIAASHCQKVLTPAETSLTQLLQEMIERGDQQELYKNADVIKAAFYKELRKEKIASGISVETQSEENTDGQQTHEKMLSIA